MLTGKGLFYRINNVKEIRITHFINDHTFFSPLDKEHTVSSAESDPANISVHQNTHDLTWLIRAEENRKIRISFSSFEADSNVEFTAGDGNDTSLNKFFVWPRRLGPPPDLLSTGNKMWIRSFYRSSGSASSVNRFSLKAFSVSSIGAYFMPGLPK